MSGSLLVTVALVTPSCLGNGLSEEGNLTQASEVTIRAQASYPKNPVALKILGATLGREGDSLKAIEQAQKHFQMVLDMPAP